MNTIVISGATSMLGIATLKAALADGVEKIYAIVRANSANYLRLPKDKRVICVECALGEYDRLSAMIHNTCEAFYHFAWEPSSKSTKSQRYFDVEMSYRNLGYALQALQAATQLGCKNFIGAGSQAEYGNLRNAIQKPEDLTDPVTCYGIAKDQARRMLIIKSQESGVHVQWVRIFSVYGTNDRKATLISSLLQKMRNNETIELTEAIQTWDYLYESDAGKALYLIGRDAVQSDVYCLGSGEERPLRDYICEIKRITGSSSRLDFGAVPYGRDAVMSLHADISKVLEKTAWKGPEVSFENGIKQIIAETYRE
jgi:nucleoside-diphosphate-sugar epimerase